MQIPAYLTKGDTIGFTCTARSITLDKLQPAIEIIESWGFKVKIGSNIGLVENQFGGSDQERAASFQALMDDDEVKAILICRGGYGTVRMLDLLDFSKFKEQPKWVLGFSDVTILHGHLNQNLGITSLHTSMPSVFETNSKSSLETICKALKGQSLQYEILPHTFNKEGNVEAEIVGGNLSLVYSMLGTKTDIDTNNKILFIEDLDECLYHIDRMMLSIKRAGKLDHLAGLIIGGMSDMNDNDTPFGKNALEIIAEHTAEFNYPICFDFPAGHIKDNRAIVLGKKGKLTVRKEIVYWEQ